MLDISFVRNHPKEIVQAATLKGLTADIEAVLKLDKKRRDLQVQFDQIRAIKNKAGATLAKLEGEAKRKALAKLKEIDQTEEKLKPKLTEVEQKLNEALSVLPNPPLPEVPKGKGEEDNIEIRKWGQPRKFDFPALDHVELAQHLNLIDFESGGKVAGNGFYFLKNEAVTLELALVQYALDFLKKKGFTPWLTPDLSRRKFYLGTGYSPRGKEAQIYEIVGQDLGLIATAEVTLAGVHAGEILEETDLPKRYAGYSHCFRQEAGAYGKYSKGLYRVHQFTKVEMFAYTKPENSPRMHEEMLDLEEKLWQGLHIPYRIVEMCTGDLGAQAARKFDLEAWMPGRGDWGEVTSASNTTDYQARRLDIRYRAKDGKVGYAHTLNGTAIATSRAIIAILENYQQHDGSVVIPDGLRPFMGGHKEIRR
jgi:seryl-tRNA synthetase